MSWPYVDGDHGPLRWSHLLCHLWHHLWCHLRLPLIFHHVSGTPSGVRGSLTGASPGATLTTTSAAVVPVTAAALEGEDLGKKGSKRMKP
jgi:hypothetical protein